MKITCVLKRLMLLMVILTLMVSCGGDEKTIQNGTLSIDESITIGQAFGNYAFFEKVKWDSFEDDQGRKIVEVTGNIDMEKMFIVDFDGVIMNMLEGEYFEDILLSAYLQAYQVGLLGGQNIVSHGNPDIISELVRESGYLTTTLSKNKGAYTCQFALTKDGFDYYASQISVSFAIVGADDIITFDMPESDNAEYLLSVYANKSFIN